MSESFRIEQALPGGPVLRQRDGNRHHALAEAVQARWAGAPEERQLPPCGFLHATRAALTGRENDLARAVERGLTQALFALILLGR